VSSPRSRRRRGRAQIYLVPGFFGFSTLGEIRYFGHVREFLKKNAWTDGDVDVHVVRSPPTSSLRTRAARLLEAIVETAGSGDDPIHLVGHSSGGLDVRLLLVPGASLPTAARAAPVLRRVRTAVTVSAPHRGTPVASFFTGLLGQRLLGLLSLSTMYVLRFGRLPVGVLLRMGAVFARLDRHLGVNSALLDQLFGQLLGDFTPARRRAIAHLMDDVRRDQDLLVQLTPAGADLLDATATPPPWVRCGSVLTVASPPGVSGMIAAGLDPTAQATHAIYRVLYEIAARGRPVPGPLDPVQAAAIRRLYGGLPEPTANDGLVPTFAQAWGEVIDVARADHLDVIGHFHDPRHRPPHVDWLFTGSGFDRPAFDAVWSRVAAFLAAADPPRRGRRTTGNVISR
jgi:triacylglycerol esterase/lipase EstA (alpha/beta hydrolase family)